MTTWKDGGDCGRMYREVVNEDESHIIAEVRIRRSAPYRGTINPVRPWLKGEANFRLILQAPQMLAALCSIRDKVECYLQPLADHPSVNRARWEAMRDQAVTAIAAVKGENGDDIG